MKDSTYRRQTITIEPYIVRRLKYCISFWSNTNTLSQLIQSANRHMKTPQSLPFLCLGMSTLVHSFQFRRSIGDFLLAKFRQWYNPSAKLMYSDCLSIQFLIVNHSKLLIHNFHSLSHRGEITSFETISCATLATRDLLLFPIQLYRQNLIEWSGV